MSTVIYASIWFNAYQSLIIKSKLVTNISVEIVDLCTRLTRVSIPDCLFICSNDNTNRDLSWSDFLGHNTQAPAHHLHTDKKKLPSQTWKAQKTWQKINIRKVLSQKSLILCAILFRSKCVEQSHCFLDCKAYRCSESTFNFYLNGKSDYSCLTRCSAHLKTYANARYYSKFEILLSHNILVCNQNVEKASWEKWLKNGTHHSMRRINRRMNRIPRKNLHKITNLPKSWFMNLSPSLSKKEEAC